MKYYIEENCTETFYITSPDLSVKMIDDQQHYGEWKMWENENTVDQAHEFTLEEAIEYCRQYLKLRYGGGVLITTEQKYEDSPYHTIDIEAGSGYRGTYFTINSCGNEIERAIHGKGETK